MYLTHEKSLILENMVQKNSEFAYVSCKAVINLINVFGYRSNISGIHTHRQFCVDAHVLKGKNITMKSTNTYKLELTGANTFTLEQN